MKEVADPISPDIIEEELKKSGLLRSTNKGNNLIYCVHGDKSPHVMKEIGRLREVTFRAAGGGTGKELDIDSYDLGDDAYLQLVVYSPEDRTLVGGYRFKEGKKALDAEGNVKLSTASYFSFSEKFKSEYLPYTIELGRSWVQPAFQPSVNPRKGIFALDNIWDGLGTLVIDYPDTRYFFGKVTMYTHFPAEGRDIILYFMNHYFHDEEKLLSPIHPLGYHQDPSRFSGIFSGLDFKEGFKVLNQYVRNMGESLPPLINIYMNLSPTMKSFGTASNPHFGDVEETGIMITIDDIYNEKKERHIHNYSGKKSV